MRSAVLLVTLAILAATAPAASAGLAGEPVEVATGLATPWDVVQPGDRRTLVVERPGRIRVVEGPGTGQALLSGGAEVNKFLGLLPHPGSRATG
jgi:glucose/arabinose dehydrogenase